MPGVSVTVFTKSAAAAPLALFANNINCSRDAFEAAGVCFSIVLGVVCPI